METSPNAEVIRATQDALGKFVKRPPLTEKLLKKPPFRFLHDIVTSVLQNHGFFEGLFEESELISENVKEREAKIAFLNKVITVLSLTTGQSLPVKPSKIISGQEPENTNKLLQCLGQALDNNLSTIEAVKKYKISSQNDQGSENKTKKPRDLSIDKNTQKTKDVKSDSSLAARGRDKVIKQNDKKENLAKPDGSKKDKRDLSISRESQKSRRDNSISRNNGKKDKLENVKKNINKSTTNQKSQDKLNITSTLKSKSSDNVTIDNNLKNTDKESESNHNIDHEVRKDAEEIANEGVEVMTIEKESIEVEGLKSSDPTLIDNNHGNQGVTNSNLTQNSNNYDNGSTSLPQMPDSDYMGSGNINTITSVNSDTEQYQDDISSSNKEYENKLISLEKPNTPVIATITPETKHELNTSQSPNLKLSRTESIENRHRSDNNSTKPCTPAPAKINSVRPPSARPPSARPGAPRLREKHDDVLSVNETASKGKVNVIIENAEADAEEDEQSLVFVDPSIIQLEKDTGTEIMLHNSSDEHGHLVQQILESQKQFSQMKTGKTDIEWEFGAQKSREASYQEVEQLRFNLQALSRAANPLGKLLDHIQEDVETMRQELNHWSKTYEDAKVELAKEKSETLQALQPLEAKSKQFDEEIADRRDKINDIKSVIHKNSLRIEKLLGSGCTQY